MNNDIVNTIVDNWDRATTSIKDINQCIKESKNIVKESRSILNPNIQMIQNIFDQAPDPMLVMNADGLIVFNNKAATNLYLYTNQELIGMHIWHVDSYMTDEQCMYAINRLLAGEVLIFETEHKSKEGTIFPIEAHVSKVEWEGKSYVLAICRNLAERKKIEELQLQILKANYEYYIKQQSNNE